MTLMVALDQDGNPAMPMYGGGNFRCLSLWSKTITSRCATVSPVITKESYKRCNLKLTDPQKLAK